jgi:hypothetical protein
MSLNMPQCSVARCDAPADYEVQEVRVTPYPDEVLQMRDPVCPYLCEEHMRENEERSTGVITYHSGDKVEYPYTHKRLNSGWSEYEPLESRHVLLYRSHEPRTTVVCREVNEELIEHLKRHPEQFEHISPRDFERVVASIFSNQGFDVELTPASRDGGG